MRLLGLLLGMLLLAANAHAADKDEGFAPDLLLIIGGDGQGKTDPCGCKTNPRGGLGQKAQILKDEATGLPLLFLDSGNSMLPKSIFDSEPEKFRLGIMGAAVAAANTKMNPVALGLGSRDFGLGVAWLSGTLAAHPSNWVLTNMSWPAETQAVPPIIQTREVAGRIVAFLAVASPHEMGVIKGPSATDPAVAVKAALDSLPGVPDFVVLMSELDVKEDGELLAAIPQVNLVVKNRNGNGTERINGNALVIQLVPEGKTLARISIDLDRPWSLKGQADRLEEEKRLRTMGETLATYRVNGDPEVAYKDKPEVLSFYRKYVVEEKSLREKLAGSPLPPRPYRLAWVDVAADHPVDAETTTLLDQAKKKAGISAPPPLPSPAKPAKPASEKRAIQ